MLLLAAAAAGQAKAAELDGELLALEAEFHRHSAEADKQFHLSTRCDDPAEQAAEAAMKRAGHAWDRMAELPARTPEGLRAKATAIEAYLPEYYPDDDVPRLVASLLRDIMGRPA